SSSSQDRISSAASTNEVYCSSQNIEDDDIYEKLQVIDELLLDDNCIFPPMIIAFFHLKSP
ncbi:hypothetical protein HAX54_023139, partial [Datura stramonium]|nr:hypothetical protein [Datura stramonium]